MRTDWQVFLKTESVWEAMNELCNNAKKEILCEQFILDTEEAGLDFIDILIKKSKEGIRVKVLCDMVGSVNLFTDGGIQKKMRNSGIELNFFNPVKLWRIDTFFSWMFRNHRKILVVDEEVGMIGGVGLRNDMREWRDTHVKVAGGVAKEMRSSFMEMWSLSHERKFLKRIRHKRSLSRGFEFITNAPSKKTHYLYEAVISAIRDAKKSIHITTPYFVPDKRLLNAIILASKRKVSVKILVPKISNHIWVDRAGQATFAKLLSKGIEIFTYSPDMIHAKTIVIDDSWATVGSMNLDSLSLAFNYEANLVSTDTVFAETLNAFFEKDMTEAERVIEWSWRKRGLKRKVLEKFAYLFRKIL